MPREDYFLTWFQTAAIPRQAKHKAAARLYLNWMLSDEFQKAWFQFPVRRDVRASAEMGSVLEHNTSPGDFHRFMLQRDRVERFRLQLLQLIGEPQGAAPWRWITVSDREAGPHQVKGPLCPVVTG